ncbi:hypothetical protein [Thermaerobacillus caldiproteolyticus]|uniref:hypothetical protein n=1 Tax=Thermaerobacillus caldiproteolyticus TaxID=247480 RepID=UPI00188BC97C|nr:hypothetical protein [Anoxybacillus caldiproteolyticus]QPA32837.1 hypothetical protein ISX45_08035 [Anoxybacillus caldiproteolyticus]
MAQLHRFSSDRSISLAPVSIQLYFDFIRPAKPHIIASIDSIAWYLHVSTRPGNHRYTIDSLQAMPQITPIRAP